MDEKKPLDEDIKISSSKKTAVKSVEEMALCIQNQLEENKAAKTKNETGEPGKQEATKEKNQNNAPKQKAKAKAKGKPQKGKAESFAFKGTQKQGPMYMKNVTVYTCPKSFNWRVKKHGDKKDKAFSWKTEDPKTVWTRLVDYVKEIST